MTTAIRFETESGSTYEIQENFGKRYIRRTNEEGEKRADGIWIRLFHSHPDYPIVGERISLLLDSLAAYGSDDQGTQDPTDFTTRLTTPVTSVEKVVIEQTGEHHED